MKNKEECSKIAIFNEKEWFRKKIVDMANNIEDVWILEQIHKFMVNMTKEGN